MQFFVGSLLGWDQTKNLLLFEVYAQEKLTAEKSGLLPTERAFFSTPHKYTCC